ncbi:hypothetical protein DSM104440_00324 [Usitatibacter palustris]|uniref:N-acetyltransferase domain-containing protein n=2 Tax=Usitatibacter palustris TaxID=2732487 RepID=A0A6M4H246_9PROT|nr:hypothetical protein DSM104440_00324 [Usitatibacter palustris]
MEIRRQSMNPHLVVAGVSISDEDQLQRVLVHFESAEVLLSGGEIIGLVKIVRNGSDWELLQIQLETARQGKGLGAQLVGQLIAEAQQAQATLKLSVLKANPARRLYERLGFVVIGEDAHTFEMRLS